MKNVLKLHRLTALILLTTLGFLLCFLNSSIANANLTTVISNIAQLRNTNSFIGDIVYVQGYYAPGDGGGGMFRFVNSYPYNVRIILGQTGLPASNERSDDGGRVIVPSYCSSINIQFTPDSCKWVRMDNGPINVKWFGAKGNGINDDTVAINNALQDAYDRGGAEVYLEPTGKPYRITNTITVSSGVVLKGISTKNFPGMTATETQWMANGSWIKVDGNVVGITLLGHGASMQGINIMHKQGTNTSWSTGQNIYNSWMVVVRSSFFHISDVMILNAPYGMIIDYPSASGGGTYSSLKNIYFSCYKVGLQIDRVNDNLDINNLHFRNVINASDVSVSQFLLNNYYAMVIGYLDNPHVSGLNFFQAYTAMYFKNGTVPWTPGINLTHSLKNGQFTNVQFNLTRFAMKVENSLTDVSGQFTNVLAQGAANVFGINIVDTLFWLRSDKIDLHFSNLVSPQTGGMLMEIGNGNTNYGANPPPSSSSFVSIDGLRITNFSALTPGPCFTIYNNGNLTVGNNNIQGQKTIYSNWGITKISNHTNLPYYTSY